MFFNCPTGIKAFYMICTARPGSIYPNIKHMKPKKTNESAQQATNTNPLPIKEQLKQNTLDMYDLVELFRVHVNTIRNWCSNGTLSYSKIGRKRFFNAEKIKEQLEVRKQVMVPGAQQKRKRGNK